MTAVIFEFVPELYSFQQLSHSSLAAQIEMTEQWSVHLGVRISDEWKFIARSVMFASGLDLPSQPDINTSMKSILPFANSCVSRSFYNRKQASGMSWSPP